MTEFAIIACVTVGLIIAIAITTTLILSWLGR